MSPARKNCAESWRPFPRPGPGFHGANRCHGDYILRGGVAKRVFAPMRCRGGRRGGEQAEAHAMKPEVQSGLNLTAAGKGLAVIYGRR